MTVTEAYAFLNSIRHIEAEIIKLQIRHDELQSCLLPKAITYDKDSVQTSPEDPMLRIASDVVDLERQIQQLKTTKAKRVVEVSGAINQLTDDNEQIILLGFYVGRLPARKIAELTHYSLSGVFKARRRAVVHLSEVGIKYTPKG